MRFKQFGTLDDFVEAMVRDIERPHVVVGPWVHPIGGEPFFIVATSVIGRGFRSAALLGESKEFHEAFTDALSERDPDLVVHVLTDPLDMARLCETLWPCERVTAIRIALEAQRNKWKATGPGAIQG